VPGVTVCPGGGCLCGRMGVVVEHLILFVVVFSNIEDGVVCVTDV
jgi:hypothetical protein